MKALKRYEINYRLRNKPNLLLVEDNNYNIPSRVEEYDKDMFVVFNKRKQRYEIHSLEYSTDDTYQMTVPFKELDARILRHLYENDIRIHGRKIFEKIERAEAKQKKDSQREYKNWIRDMASETRSMFAKDAWL